MPILRLFEGRPRRGLSGEGAAFLGGMYAQCGEGRERGWLSSICRRSYCDAAGARPVAQQTTAKHVVPTRRPFAAASSKESVGQMESILKGDMSAVVAFTAGDRFDRSLERALSRRFTCAITHSIKSCSHLRHRPLTSTIIQSFSKAPGEWSASMAVLLLSRFAVHFIKGCAVGLGMWTMEWWLVSRVHSLLRVRQ